MAIAQRVSPKRLTQLYLSGMSNAQIASTVGYKNAKVVGVMLCQLGITKKKKNRAIAARARNQMKLGGTKHFSEIIKITGRSVRQYKMFN